MKNYIIDYCDSQNNTLRIAEGYTKLKPSKELAKTVISNSCSDIIKAFVYNTKTYKKHIVKI